jgi:hypothetical protein
MLELPTRMYKETYRCITDLDSELTYKTKVGRFFRKFFRVVIHGTVTSGHPTRTTFGNSLRVILYWKFIFHELNITDYEMFVGGDDFQSFILEKDLSILTSNVHKYFSKESVGNVGLG